MLPRSFCISLWDYADTQELPFYHMGLCRYPGVALFLCGIMKLTRGCPITPWDYADAQMAYSHMVYAAIQGYPVSKWDYKLIQGMSYFHMGLCSNPEDALLPGGIMHMPRGYPFSLWDYAPTKGLPYFCVGLGDYEATQ